MTAVTIDRVSRSFGSVQAVHDVSLDIRDGEFFTLLGPSGCGKTTLLRMIAGFCELDAGTISFGGRRIDTLPPHRRNTGMVFQNYAIFPNFTVGGNVGYGLRARNVAPAQITERVATALKLVHLDGHDTRWPHQLSGGQLQQTLGITAIYVTHDQEEALSISDRIAVMRAGTLEQVDKPDAVYRYSATPFVAEFMGITNLLSGKVSRREGSHVVLTAGKTEFHMHTNAAPMTDTVGFCLRPEALRIVADRSAVPDGWASLETQILRVEFLGALTRVETRLADGEMIRIAVLDHPVDNLAIGTTLTLAYDPRRVTELKTS